MYVYMYVYVCVYVCMYVCMTVIAVQKSYFSCPLFSFPFSLSPFAPVKARVI